MNLTGAGEPERLNVDAITAVLFPMLGVRPASGRLFLPEEDTPGALKVALVSHALSGSRWRSASGNWRIATVGREIRRRPLGQHTAERLGNRRKRRSL